MSKPTERAWDILKYLVQYLLGRVEYGLLMKLAENDTSNDVDLLVYSDSDWAGHKGPRKSASSRFVKVDGVLFTQLIEKTRASLHFLLVKQNVTLL